MRVDKFNYDDYISNLVDDEYPLPAGAINTFIRGIGPEAQMILEDRAAAREDPDFEFEDFTDPRRFEHLNFPDRDPSLAELVHAIFMERLSKLTADIPHLADYPLTNGPREDSGGEVLIHAIIANELWHLVPRYRRSEDERINPDGSTRVVIVHRYE